VVNAATGDGSGNTAADFARPRPYVTRAIAMLSASCCSCITYDAALVAVDGAAATGARTVRLTGPAATPIPAAPSPTAWRYHCRELQPAVRFVTGHDPLTGEELWRI
jgi:hypothetical protein